MSEDTVVNFDAPCPLPADTGVTHELKTWPGYFQQVIWQEKLFEVRKDDRSFKVGDRLRLEEWDPINQVYTGRICRVAITSIFRAFGLVDGFCVLGIVPIYMIGGTVPVAAKGR